MFFGVFSGENKTCLFLSWNQQKRYENLPYRLKHNCLAIILIILTCLGDSPDPKVTVPRILPRAWSLLEPAADIVIMKRKNLKKFIFENAFLNLSCPVSLLPFIYSLHYVVIKALPSLYCFLCDCSTMTPHEGKLYFQIRKILTARSRTV